MSVRFAGLWPFGISRLARKIRPSDRKSTRLNSSHSQISYAVLCLKKKDNQVPHLSVIKTIYESSRQLFQWLFNRGNLVEITQAKVERITRQQEVCAGVLAHDVQDF